MRERHGDIRRPRRRTREEVRLNGLPQNEGPCLRIDRSTTFLGQSQPGDDVFATSMLDTFANDACSPIPCRVRAFPRSGNARTPRRRAGSTRTIRRAATDSGGSSDGDGPPRRRLRRASRGPPGHALAVPRAENRDPRDSTLQGRVEARGLIVTPACSSEVHRSTAANRRYHRPTGRASFALFPAVLRQQERSRANA